ncbi:LysR family transcriptional regulator [Saccharopolyspora sp. NPDC050389]|uniref:LysR family transcriptional regulator n=1 Tax=Saccharopolyspora sp. NPDC050389 TaxID=3155516 RepID=UPI0033D3C1AA
MEFRQAEQFLAVVEHGGLVHAAAALHIAQPSLSQTIRTLERELKAPLFHRVGRGLVLTSAGEALVKPARQLLRDLATARASVAEVAGIRGGQLDIAAMGGPLEFILPAVGSFRRRHPEVFVRLESPSMESELLHQVRQGHSELGFTPPLADEDPHQHQGLEMTTFPPTPLMLVLPPDADPDLPDPLPIEQIPDIPTTAIPGGAYARSVVETALRNARVQTRLAVVTAHRNTQTSLVLRGIGMAFTTREQAVRAREHGALIRHLDPPIALTNCAVRRPAPLSPAARIFLALASECLVDRAR